MTHPAKRPGRCSTTTHDSVRNRTTTLFAALSVVEGTAFGECLKRHRHEEFLDFLRQIDRKTPADMDRRLFRRQLRHAQAAVCQTSDREASPVPSALHSDLPFMAQSG